MKWEKITRSSGLIEYVCEHGVGHPDVDSAKKIAEKYGHDVDTWLIHGCCEERCCCRDDFPGK